MSAGLIKRPFQILVLLVVSGNQRHFRFPTRFSGLCPAPASNTFAKRLARRTPLARQRSFLPARRRARLRTAHQTDPATIGRGARRRCNIIVPEIAAKGATHHLTQQPRRQPLAALFSPTLLTSGCAEIADAARWRAFSY